MFPLCLQHQMLTTFLHSRPPHPLARPDRPPPSPRISSPLPLYCPLRLSPSPTPLSFPLHSSPLSSPLSTPPPPSPHVVVGVRACPSPTRATNGGNYASFGRSARNGGGKRLSELLLERPADELRRGEEDMAGPGMRGRVCARKVACVEGNISGYMHL